MRWLVRSNITCREKFFPRLTPRPESLELNQIFARALARGGTEAVMEVSSHALQQARVFGIPVDVAVFSNLTPGPPRLSRNDGGILRGETHSVRGVRH